MGKVYGGIAELVGRTPLVRLARLERACGLTGRLLAKLEIFNPSGSVKDRIALSMIEAAERDGRLRPGGAIVEATSGNTGIGLAALAAARGYRAILVMPDNMSRERIQILKGFGAEVILTPADLLMPGAGAKAAEIAAAIPGAFIPAQQANPANPQAHREGTGPEIWEDADGDVDIFVSAIGTGGTITGAGQFLKQRKPDIHVVAVEPSASAVLTGGAPGVHAIQGIGGGVIPPVLDRTVYDEIVVVEDADAFRLAKQVARVEGLSVGPSAGAALWSAVQVLRRAENRGKSAVVIIPDSGERYLSPGVFDAPSQSAETAAPRATVQDWIGKEVQPSGQFARQPNRFVAPFGDGPGKLPVEPGRYRLIWSQACPWAHRAVIVRRLLGLDAVISLGTVDPVRPDRREGDWAFTLDAGGRDPVLGVAFLSELYRRADPAYQGRCTVPAVADIATGHVVNNDYFQLTRYLEVEWRAWHSPGAPDLYPVELRPEIDALNQVLFDDVNNGVYKCGFARSQSAYDEAFATLFRRLDWLEARLAERRFLFGDFVTESDVRLYATLARFDVAYYDGFRANRNRLVDFPNLSAYARDLFAIPGFGDTTEFDAIKRHYHLCAVAGNTFRLVPKGPDLSGWRAAAGREVLSRHPDQVFREGR